MNLCRITTSRTLPVLLKPRALLTAPVMCQPTPISRLFRPPNNATVLNSPSFGPPGSSLFPSGGAFVRRWQTSGPWRAGGAETRRLMADLPRLQFPLSPRRLILICSTILASIATLSGLYVYYFGAALRYPAPVRKLLREALIYHKHASTLDYERAIHAYEQALAVLADTPGFPPADDHVTGILVELADVLDRAKRWAEAAAVDKDLLERWVGQQGMEDPVLVGRRLAAGAIEGHQSPGNSSVVRETIMKALGTSHHLADMYSKVYKSSHSDEVPDSNIVGDSDSDALLRGRERALEWSVQVVMVALGLFHSPAPKESQSSTTPPPDTSAQPSTDSSSSSSPSNIFAGLPVVPMDANRLPPWITYQEVGGCLEALALYYANEGHRPQIALAMYSSLIELIGDRDPCHASVLMTHCAQILADHAHNLPRAKHWLDHALSVATQFQHNNPECADNCTAAWYSYGILEERVGNSSGALKQFKKAHYNAKQKGQLETQGLAQQAIDRLVAADPNR